MMSYVVPETGKVPAALAKIGIHPGDVIMRDDGSRRIRIHREIEDTPQAALNALAKLEGHTGAALLRVGLRAGISSAALARLGLDR
jgi:class 3 adenylate cyclase